MKTIVILDDELTLADLLALALANEGFAVYTGGDGAGGLALIAEHVPDLVILDCMMPLLDGPGVLRAMRKDEVLARIPVVMMSSLPEAAVDRRCAGLSAFVRKPFPVETLLDAVERVLAQGGNVSQTSQER
jgi:DNA-binding response OmpR family regulator